MVCEDMDSLEIRALCDMQELGARHAKLTTSLKHHIPAHCKKDRTFSTDDVNGARKRKDSLASGISCHLGGI